MLTWSTAGESHGAALIALIEGLPAGIEIQTTDLESALARRRRGYGRGARQKFEADHVVILSGVRHGLSTGAPLAIQINNSEWPKWETVMSADPVAPEALLVDAGKGDEREMGRNRPLHTPRPGHADLAGMISYDLDDARDVLERASARETAARVALGAVASAYLAQVAQISIVSQVVAVGPEHAPQAPLPRPEDAEGLDSSDVRVLDREVAQNFRAVIDEARHRGDTVGGVAEVVAWNVPLGLGSHVASNEKLDAGLAAALMSIQSVKAVEIGEGFSQCELFGSQAHDEIVWDSDGSASRVSNRAGGIEGGTSNGEPIVARAAFKPIATVPRALRTVDLKSGVEASGFHQRSDTCQVVPGAVIAEAVVALEIARALDERLGGRSVREVRAHLEWWRDYVAQRLRRPLGDGSQISEV